MPEKALPQHWMAYNVSLSLSSLPASVHALASPNQLCTPCTELCLQSKLLAKLPAAYERWERDREDNKTLYVPERQCERFSHHNYSNLDTCRSKGHCHLCAIFWEELAAEVGQRRPLERLQALEDDSGEKSDGIVVTITHGGGSIVNYCLLSFEIDGQPTNTYIQVLMSAGEFDIDPAPRHSHL